MTPSHYCGADGWTPEDMVIVRTLSVLCANPENDSLMIGVARLLNWIDDAAMKEVTQ